MAESRPAGIAFAPPAGRGILRRVAALVGSVALTAPALPAWAETPGSPPGRAEAIAGTAARIRAELDAHGGGNWQLWSDRLEPFRRELRKRIQSAVPGNPAAPGAREARAKVLASQGDLPLYECDPEGYLEYLTARPRFPRWLKDRQAIDAVIASSRWLESRGIELVFVPVPKLTEVYPDQMAQAVPPDRIVAPQMRRLVLELVEAGVEVVDLLPELLAAREAAPEPLYEACDPHWSERGRRIAADVLAARLARHDFVRQAQALEPRFEARPIAVPAERTWACYGALDSEQQARVAPLAVSNQTELLPRPGGAPLPDDDAIVLLGDSYNGGLARLLKPRLNLWVSESWSAAGSTERLADFLREPELLAGRRVAILVASNWNVFANEWRVPRPIAELAKEKR